MPVLTENNPQVFAVLAELQSRINEALASARTGRIMLEDLNFNGKRLHPWTTPAISYKMPLDKISANP